jgi:hypothetical protein
VELTVALWKVKHVRRLLLPFRPNSRTSILLFLYVNGERKHRHTRDNPLCYKCGIPSHTAVNCDRESTLTTHDRQFLYELGQAEAQLWREARDAKAATEFTNVGSIRVDILEDSMRCFTMAPARRGLGGPSGERRT